MINETDNILTTPMPEQFDITLYLDKQLENTSMPSESTLHIRRKHKYIRIHLQTKKKNEVKLEHLKELLPTLPDDGWSYHVISSGNFDFWTYVPHLINLAGRFDEFYCSTWTMSRPIALEMLELYDSGKVGKISLLTGLYFKRRETAVYAFILDGLLKRSQRYIAFRNHTKLMLLGNDDYHLTIEGSANLTANPRAEQFILTNHKGLYEFNRAWMEEMLNGKT